MTIKRCINFLLVLALFQNCLAQQALPQVENHLEGELDYTYEALELVQKQVGGTEINLGTINKDGSINFILPEYDIKALYDSINLQHYVFQQLFQMSNCKGKKMFVESPYDDVYSQRFDPIYVKKYGIKIAALYPVSDEQIVSRNQNNRAVFPSEAKYFWFYIDRDIDYIDECIKESSWVDDNIELTTSADLELKKGWNFIEENLVEVQEVGEGDSRSTQPKKVTFTKISPASNKVKWILKVIQTDEKLETAKRLFSFTPIEKSQFEKWVPNKLSDLSLTTQEHGNLPRGRRNKNNMHLIYTNESRKKEIDLYIVDCAKHPDDMEMIDFAFAMENDGKDEKDFKPYVTQYNEAANTTMLLYKVEDRVIVNASGVNINAEELWAYIKKLKVKKLLKK